MESEVSGAGQTAAPALDERKDAGESTLNAGPQAADRTSTSPPGHEFLKDWPTGPAVSRTQAGGRLMDPAKREEPREAPIQAGGEMGPGAVTAVEPAVDAGDGEGRRGAPPAPGRPEGEEGEVAAGEAPSVQELLSRVDRVIESARTQKGPDAPVAAGQDASSAGSPRKALLNRVTRALRSIRKRPSEEERRRIIVR